MKKSLSLFVLFNWFIFSSLINCQAADKNYKGYVRGDALITAEELKDLIDKKTENLVIFGILKKEKYQEGHIPNSYQLWRPDYGTKTAKYGGMRATPEEFTALMQKHGVNNNSHIVLYDDAKDATRVWWLLRIYGKKDNVQILDGGLRAWNAMGYPRESAAPALPSKLGDFKAKFQGDKYMMANLAEVEKAQKSSEYQIWDTRSKGEWDGSKVKKGAFGPGHLKNATFQEWKLFKDNKTTMFKPAGQISKVIRDMGMDPKKKQIFYCQSGVRTTTNMFALYLLGWDESKLLNSDESWIGYSYNKYKENGNIFDIIEKE